LCIYQNLNIAKCFDTTIRNLVLNEKNKNNFKNLNLFLDRTRLISEGRVYETILQTNGK